MIDAGFSLEEVSGMHLCQIKAFSAAADRKVRRVGVNIMNLCRIAYHADTNEYNDALRDMQKD